MTRLSAIPGYRPLLALRLVSSVVLWLDFTLIFSLLSFHWHADAMMVGVASALYGLPGLVVGPLFGSLADRRNPVGMLVISYLARGVTSMLMILAPDVHVFVLLVFAKGLANLGAMPAEQVLTRSMLNNAQLVSNTGVMTAVDQFTKICAPLVAAGVAGLYEPSAGLWLSSALALVGILCLPALGGITAAPAAVAPRPMRHYGPLLKLARHNLRFRQAFACMLCISTILGLYDPLLSLFLKEQGMPASTFGMVVSATAGGAFAGALVFRRIYARHARRLPSLALMAFGLTVLLPGVLVASVLMIPASLWLALWALNGGAYGLVAMTFGVTLQHESPRELVGNISAAARSVQLGALVLGPLLGAALTRELGVPVVFALSGSLAIFGGVLLLWCAARVTGSVVARTDPAECP